MLSVVNVRLKLSNVTSVFLFFSCYPQINDIKIEKCLLLFTANTNILILLYRELKTGGTEKFYFCRLPLKSNLTSLILHCASLLRSIFASLARANERVRVHNERNFPQAKLDSEINARFLLNEHGNLYFVLHNNSVQINLLPYMHKWGKFGPSHILSENGELLFLIFFFFRNSGW